MLTNDEGMHRLMAQLRESLAARDEAARRPWRRRRLAAGAAISLMALFGVLAGIFSPL